VRDVSTVIDEPKEREGINMGPTPTETMVAALIACTNVISHKCAKKHGVEFKTMTVDAESTLERLIAAILKLSMHFPLGPPQSSCLKGGHGHGPRQPAEALRLALSGPPADAG
jgi:hypothetical protein